MQPDQTDQRKSRHVFDALPLFFAACVVAVMLIAMLLTFLSDISATLMTRF